MTFSASYDPTDNKLRLYASSRLDTELYARVKAAGFCWAPKQDLFVAPMWTPKGEDLMLELAGEIGDEDSSLVDRAEERSDRFDEYREHRIRDARQAEDAVSAIADGIPLGQPVLVGHHSERHARKDAERIQGGMRKAVQMWKTASYWEDRAAGAIRHAKYRELPGVRHRRIKTLEASLRGHERDQKQARDFLRVWTLTAEQADPDKQLQMARHIANSGHCNLTMPRKDGDREDWTQRCSAYDALTNGYPSLNAPRTVGEVTDAALVAYPKTIAYCERWIEHYTNRIAYEKAMLGEGGGIKADTFAFEVGGKVLARYAEWLVILKVNTIGDVTNSVTTTPPKFWGSHTYVSPVEEVREYKPPTPEDTAAVKAATKLPPLCNYPGDGFKEMTSAEWKRMGKTTDAAQTRKHTATDTIGAHRTRVTYGLHWAMTTVYLTDAKRVDPPPVNSTQPVSEAVHFEPAMPRPVLAPKVRDERIPGYEHLNAMMASAKTVQTVVVPDLFITPVDLAKRMVELANIQHFDRVLEPSAGTGVLIKAIIDGEPSSTVVAVEINSTAVSALIDRFDRNYVYVTQADFLEWAGLEHTKVVNRVVMNPPFARNQDIKHVRAAFGLLAVGGRLVAVMSPHWTFAQDSESVAFRAWLSKYKHEWENLPAQTFKASGTMVNTVLLTIDR